LARGDFVPIAAAGIGLLDLSIFTLSLSVCINPPGGLLTILSVKKRKTLG
jgi:hypothetical protein